MYSARAISAIAALLIGAILLLVTLGAQSEPRKQVNAAAVTVAAQQ
ncbi:MAG: hypothetical protein LJE97_03160 [Betaproteobacteria bacterium]|jgi:hypothetical protein|nr:hypothetical protein [Betaproteobacteria bacterium]